ncbi:hypothetical protein A3E96_00060 [Candidatus Uhrbacteria bacterium RIFCSPHIGHO2_12_FULL_46_13]|uniref:Uncharacterized protein n=1 Tax=Candidatus Uhrbacteria bacterium RIFCSPLOWO2_01_FULL_47_25 TaxID=1802402 RepID=A0A1F7UY78_9BACT|nr:MAG: hypothetical protein UX68_C0002G0007 [Parcubacteria group bacterium GW2011_GWA2_46_9]OGL68608.1 MAG: hypothetical protein A3D60_00730 [Candidatus Uhrbacteria bacterium RIFCSPHIGHO2_02_FULL_47_29]OGL75773.1 MAG: hypothetical protein A3E96_00060 [Candidatus Uhrbacteria bacterium RIFCSPHIGHO2_12_FULL_46_13]OGL83211.1 MAG: hypothetical protein A2936_04730 [Candidatus Uhrbacteria bacterium RIFCSPLOWO2_01_FULL_47_25]OGL86128.1 MAG: hypothetical protein A3I37_00175 [Candidatus Uhrbacteria bact
MQLNIDRRKIIITAVVVILLLIAIVGGWWYWRSSVSPISGPATQPPPLANSLPPIKPTSVPVRTPDEERQETVSRLVRLFAERFGTFSNQSRYEGINDLMAVTTDSFQRWLQEKYLPEIKQKNINTTYAGQTTRVMSVTVDEITDEGGQATARVQQVITVAAGEDEVRYPILKVTVVRQDSMWLVDSAYWEKTP